MAVWIHLLLATATTQLAVFSKPTKLSRISIATYLGAVSARAFLGFFGLFKHFSHLSLKIANFLTKRENSPNTFFLFAPFPGYRDVSNFSKSVWPNL